MTQLWALFVVVYLSIYLAATQHHRKGRWAVQTHLLHANIISECKKEACWDIKIHIHYLLILVVLCMCVFVCVCVRVGGFLFFCICGVQ